MLSLQCLYIPTLCYNILFAQVRVILFDVRTETLAYQSEHGVTDLRKCPYCGLTWTKIEGCDGETECGSRPSVGFDVRDSNSNVMATFTFRIISGKLKISKSGTRTLDVSSFD